MLLVNRKMLIIHTFLRPRHWAHPNSPPGDLASVYQKSDRISKKGLMRAPPMVIIHVFLRVNNAWQSSNLGPERGGAQPSRQAAVVWREHFRGRVMRSKAVRPLAAAPAPHGATTNFACVAWRARGVRMRAQGVAPLQPWRALTARHSEVPPRLRRGARRRAGPARPYLRIDYDSVMRDCCNLEFLFRITINARRSSPTCRAHGVGGRQTLDAAVAGIADTA